MLASHQSTLLTRNLLSSVCEHRFHTRKRNITHPTIGPGFKNERVNYIHANHHEICKYSTPEDPNYITIRSALAAAIGDLLRGGMSHKNVPLSVNNGI